ncbi:DNA-binding LacI/PurR family transcriptional regulator [Thermocatellispora tengchongensis]|uniref:DNA-binding LacI/PurR family transcriptional regulator n=1 Tax=Thermocatellispora tengchongensis TaxID=1073253 RepID=A0A840PGV5_9ACTN|nr:DNA-binding LacI/PurR family transcriptional regulator [Thermocatellispora tengchongensis]
MSTSTRRQVHDAMSRLGYVRRRAPRGVSARRSDQLIAAVVCESPQRLFTEPFYARLLAAADDTLAGHGVPMMIMTATPNTSTITAPPLVAGTVDGILLIGARERHPLMVTLAASGVPIRSIGRLPDGLEMPYVDMDNRDGGRQAAEHLLLAGRRAIAAIGGPPGLPGACDRLEGFLQTLAKAGMTNVPVAYGDFTHASGGHAMQWLLGRIPHLDAVFAGSDTMAAAAIQTLKRAGRRVPDDVAVIGYDDAPIARHTNPPLTTIRQPIEELTSVAVRLLLMATATGETPANNPILPTELVIRDSA